MIAYRDLVLSFVSAQNTLVYQRETRELLRHNAQLIELVQKLGHDHDEPASIDHSRL